MNDLYWPTWPTDDEWEPWGLANPKDSFETRKHKEMILFERRCRHCKTMLDGLPPQPCASEDCQAANMLGDLEPTSFKVVRQFDYGIQRYQGGNYPESIAQHKWMEEKRDRP